MFKSPGPCYGLPGLTGQPQHDPRSAHKKGPAYPFGIKHGKLVDDCSPGPSHFPQQKIYRDGRDGTPHYSLYSRKPDKKLFQTPGPGAYAPENTGDMGKYRAPIYTLRAKYKHRTTENTPGEILRQKGRTFSLDLG